MRTKREDAPAKVRNFYKSAKSLIDMSNGEIKPGMLPMVLRMTGGISRAKEEDYFSRFVRLEDVPDWLNGQLENRELLKPLAMEE